MARASSSSPRLKSANSSVVSPSSRFMLFPSPDKSLSRSSNEKGLTSSPSKESLSREALAVSALSIYSSNEKGSPRSPIISSTNSVWVVEAAGVGTLSPPSIAISSGLSPKSSSENGISSGSSLSNGTGGDTSGCELSAANSCSLGKRKPEANLFVVDTACSSRSEILSSEKKPDAVSSLSLEKGEAGSAGGSSSWRCFSFAKIEGPLSSGVASLSRRKPVLLRVGDCQL